MSHEDLDFPSLVEWKAAFIEDAEDLHLVTKASFATAIVCWAEEGSGVDDVREAYYGTVLGGRDRLSKVVKRARDSLNVEQLAALKVDRKILRSKQQAKRAQLAHDRELGARSVSTRGAGDRGVPGAVGGRGLDGRDPTRKPDDAQ